MNYLLDTNIIITYLRDTNLTHRLESKLGLLSGAHNLLVSVVSIGEIRSIAKQNEWGEKKLTRLDEILNDFLIADINVETIIERYAEIDAFSQGRLKRRPTTLSARNMGKNDLWIAATASVFDLELLTTDKDFDHLMDHYLRLNRVDLSQV